MNVGNFFCFFVFVFVLIYYIRLLLAQQTKIHRYNTGEKQNSFHENITWRTVIAKLKRRFLNTADNISVNLNVLKKITAVYA